MICRFENRLTGHALALSGARERVCAYRAEELPAVFDAIDAARRAGRWVAVLADYELGEWLVPDAVRPPSEIPGSSAVNASLSETQGTPAAKRAPLPGAGTARPRLTMLAYEHAAHETPWRALPLDTEASIVSVMPTVQKPDYLNQIKEVRAKIARGELYQLNYTFGLDVTTQGDETALYRRLANRHPSAHAAFIEDEGRTILSFSPELFIERKGARVTTRPMKGTAPRMADPLADEASGEALLASEKDRSENLMIVDLLRNDLGRLAPPGGVTLEALFTLEKYPSVWTMTSTVSADLPDTPLRDILAALFPCGSITGAPKIAAMQHIRTMEASARGLYCGSIGWIAPDGDFSLNVAIRTLVLDGPGRGNYHVGGGIVYDSDPLLEWEECLWKARVLTS